ncbi:hypothetical protein [Pseudochelatococcus contaminans]|uniref:Multisubunit Na+/H+ antiporter MnhB subunit n=1 Tax=Pseudochelatococcus contaminans TaxID=1538103 RepID=A0A7W6EFB2_9HYPH|nr:hypothetical protein [Pseudochelatococcus contaminans]MBB3808656.1 multisubunit Na+/H+ antiporter MnhB subunit [Pseudochelatococcus contaminans]
MSIRTVSRRERARRRRHLEEVAAWIILPVIVIITWVVGSQVYKEFEEPISSFMQSMNAEP